MEPPVGSKDCLSSPAMWAIGEVDEQLSQATWADYMTDIIEIKLLVKGVCL